MVYERDEQNSGEQVGRSIEFPAELPVEEPAPEEPVVYFRGPEAGADTPPVVGDGDRMIVPPAPEVE